MDSSIETYLKNFRRHTYGWMTEFVLKQALEPCSGTLTVFVQIQFGNPEAEPIDKKDLAEEILQGLFYADGFVGAAGALHLDVILK